MPIAPFRTKDDKPRNVLTEFERKVNRWFVLVHDLVTLPMTVVALFYSRRIHPDYHMTWRKKFRLGWRMYWNGVHIETATSFKAHLAMAAKLLEIRPETKGVVVECGCFQGGSAANLSLACEAAGRELVLYDSFEGLPAAEKGDRYATEWTEGAFRGSIETVRGNITKYGAIDVCTFRKGWFKDTLPNHTEPVLMMFLDVDFQASMHDCLINLWPKLVHFGYCYIDEYVLVDYCSVFFSERYWRTYFDTTPPGLFGTGTGVPIGQYFVGPFLATPPLQSPGSIAYTFKGASGYWDYFPEDYEVDDGRGADGGTGTSLDGAGSTTPA